MTNTRHNSDKGMSFEIFTTAHQTSDLAKPCVVIRDTGTGNRQMIGSVPEALQRQCNEKTVKLSRLSNIFLSGHLDWRSVGGLPGLILTLSDQGLQSLSLYHGEGTLLQYLIASWRLFVYRFSFSLNTVDAQAPVSLDHLTMTPVNIESTRGTAEFVNGSNADKLRGIVSCMFPGLKQPAPYTKIKSIGNLLLPTFVHKPSVSTSWIFQAKPTRGVFKPVKAIALGVPYKKFGDLCNFKPVTLEDGTVVQPEEVLSPNRTFQPVLFLDIPTEEYLANALKHDWTEHGPYTLVYHFLGDEIDPSTPEYIAFIESFGPDTKHLIGQKKVVPDTINFQVTYRLSLLWHTLMGKTFPLAKHSPAEKPLPELANVSPLVAGQLVTLKASTPTTIDDAVPLDDTYYGQLYDNEVKPVGFKACQKRDSFISHALEGPDGRSLPLTPDLDKSLKDQVQTIVLGTGSALPGQSRNVLSNIIRVPFAIGGKAGFRSVVLDAGEGTLGSLQRLFSEQDLSTIFSEIQTIYLSHLHADHHIGIISLVEEWIKREKQNGTQRKLYIVSPWQYERFLDELNCLERFNDSGMLEYISCDEFGHQTLQPELAQTRIEDITVDQIDKIVPVTRERQPRKAVAAQLVKDLKLNKFQTCYAMHCDYSYSCTIGFKLNDNGDQFLVSYSGDTRPRPYFAKIGSGSDLLIHEASFEDSDIKDALTKKHTTTTEALYIGALMNAKNILLTHFSQRGGTFKTFGHVYDYLASAGDVETLQTPIFSETLTEEQKKRMPSIKVVLAFDNMLLSYKRFNHQRQVIEREGVKIRQLFFKEEETESAGAEAQKDSELHGTTTQEKANAAPVKDSKVKKRRYSAT